MLVTRINSRHKRTVLAPEQTFLFHCGRQMGSPTVVGLDFKTDDDRETFRLEMTNGEALWLADYITRVLTNVFTRDAAHGLRDALPPEVLEALQERVRLAQLAANQKEATKGGWAREVDRLTKVVEDYADVREASRFGGGTPTAPPVAPPAARPGPMSASRSPRRPHGKERP